MTRHDQELLDKQLWGVSSQIPAERQNDADRHNNTDDHLVGMGIGGILSKTMHTNTHYAALGARINRSSAVSHLTG